MREIDVRIIEETVARLCVEANHYLGEDVKDVLREMKNNEDGKRAKGILKDIEKNIAIAEKGVFPLCQDTGMACVFLDIGQNVHLVGGDIEEAINRGVAKGYADGYLRKSIVKDPLKRINTEDNTPADIYYNIIPGNSVRILVAPKGFGSENMGQIKMLPPSAGEKGVEDFVIKACEEAGANPCPPIVVGVGIGGSFSKVAVMAKKALLKPVDGHNEDPYYAEMEERILKKINETGIGPQGLGGKTTALKVNIITAPTHIAGLPVAVNINCHVARHKEAII